VAGGASLAPHDSFSILGPDRLLLRAYCNRIQTFGCNCEAWSAAVAGYRKGAPWHQACLRYISASVWGSVLFVKDVIINYLNTELPHLVNNPINCTAVIALPDMYLGMS
jgi:hypothetical protein